MSIALLCNRITRFLVSELLYNNCIHKYNVHNIVYYCFIICFTHNNLGVYRKKVMILLTVKLNPYINL